MTNLPPSIGVKLCSKGSDAREFWLMDSMGDEVFCFNIDGDYIKINNQVRQIEKIKRNKKFTIIKLEKWVKGVTK